MLEYHSLQMTAKEKMKYLTKNQRVEQPLKDIYSTSASLL